MSRLLLTIAAVTLVATAPLPVAAQQESTDGSRVMSKMALAKAREHTLTTIQGNALDSSNARMSHATVRLRDARYGRIADIQLTDNSGLFAFKAIDPGSYIVEIVAPNQSVVLGASQLLNVNPGEAVSAIVKLPFRVRAVTSLLGTAVSPSLTAVAAEAAVNSVAAIVPTTPVSPNQ